jgi:hypothetical protein
LGCLKPDGVIPFLATLTDADCLKCIVTKCSRLVDPALNVMFEQIEMFRQAHVALTGVKDVRTVSVMVDSVKRNLTGERASRESLRVIMALIAPSGWLPFDAAMISERRISLVRLV